MHPKFKAKLQLKIESWFSECVEDELWNDIVDSWFPIGSERLMTNAAESVFDAICKTSQFMVDEFDL